MSNALNYDYGGWVSNNAPATGSAPNLVRMIGWLAAASTLFAAVGTGGVLAREHLQRNALDAQHATATTESGQARTPNENLSRIREVLKPAVSDLANALQVSRQTIYNWLNGEAVADGNAARLHDLAQAADVLAHAGIEINATLMKRKFANGRTLLQVAQAGESAKDAAVMLARIHKDEAAQRERLNARYAKRANTPASADFDLPAANDQV